MFAITFVMIVLILTLLILAIPLIVGILVYCDANKRIDCNPWLWAFIAALAPSFVGLIIYLIIRGDFPLKPELMHYDQFGNPIPQQTEAFPKWAKILLIVMAVLFIMLMVGGCAAMVYGFFVFDPTYYDSFYYSF